MITEVARLQKVNIGTATFSEYHKTNSGKADNENPKTVEPFINAANKTIKAIIE